MTERVETEVEDRCNAPSAISVEPEAQVEQALLRTLDEFDRKRLTLLQELMATIDRPDYGKRQQAVADQFGITVRSVRRWMRQLREQGIASVIRRSRSDRGQFRVSAEWQAFIVKTYRDGNRGSRCLSPAQVAVRVKVRAQELGSTPYPSHMSVYRILKPLIDRANQPKRSIGWWGSRLLLATREGLEIGVEWSNQAWQCDHTRIDLLLMSGCSAVPPWGNRELDICLMRQERRTVYRSGYLQFANLTYQGEHLAAYAGELVIIRYNPRDITTIYIYQREDTTEVFLTRAHAQGWETETLSYREAQAISQRKREAGNGIDPGSQLAEMRDRDDTVQKLQRQKQKKQNANVLKPATISDSGLPNPEFI